MVCHLRSSSSVVSLIHVRQLNTCVFATLPNPEPEVVQTRLQDRIHDASFMPVVTAEIAEEFQPQLEGRVHEAFFGATEQGSQLSRCFRS